jgi:hypothetical protein
MYIYILIDVFSISRYGELLRMQNTKIVLKNNDACGSNTITKYNKKIFGYKYKPKRHTNNAYSMAKFYLF